VVAYWWRREQSRQRRAVALACPLVHALEASLWDRYGTFAGQPAVRGTIRWTVAGRRIVIAGWRGHRGASSQPAAGTCRRHGRRRARRARCRECARPRRSRPLPDGARQRREPAVSARRPRRARRRGADRAARRRADARYWRVVILDTSPGIGERDGVQRRILEPASDIVAIALPDRAPSRPARHSPSSANPARDADHGRAQPGPAPPRPDDEAAAVGAARAGPPRARSDRGGGGGRGPPGWSHRQSLRRNRTRGRRHACTHEPPDAHKAARVVREPGRKRCG
jgi:hypothetical protein